MEKKLKVEEVYECMALLGGFKNEELKISAIGFNNEKSISEGMRRIGNKTLKKLNENWPQEQLQAINSLTKDVLSPVEEGEERNDEIALLNLKQGKSKELLESEVTIIFEELPDFKILDSRLEERKESLSYNYTYIFERLFLGY